MFVLTDQQPSTSQRLSPSDWDVKLNCSRSPVLQHLWPTLEPVLAQINSIYPFLNHTHYIQALKTL